MKNIHTYFFILFLCSCSNPFLNEKEYIRWIAGHKDDLCITKDIGNFKIKVEYIPVDLKILQDCKGVGLTKEKYDSMRRKLDGMQYYIIRLSLKDKNFDLLQYQLKDESDYALRVKYLSFDIQQDLKLEEEGLSSPCLLSLFERTYGLSPEVTIDAAFANTHKNCSKTFVWEDNMFNNGTINITFDKKLFNRIPNLKLQ